MDGNSIILAGGLMSLGMRVGMGCAKRHKKAKSLDKQKLSSLIISKGCGKTQLKKSLESLTNNLIIIDVDEDISWNTKIEKQIRGSEYIKKLLDEFPKKNFLLLVSEHDDSEHFKVDTANTFAVCPSIKLFNTLKGNIDTSLPGGTELINEMEVSMMNLVKKTEPNNLNIFGSFDELYSVIKKVYKLQSTF